MLEEKNEALSEGHTQTAIATLLVRGQSFSNEFSQRLDSTEEDDGRVRRLRLGQTEGTRHGAMNHTSALTHAETMQIRQHSHHLYTHTHTNRMPRASGVREECFAAATLQCGAVHCAPSLTLNRYSPYSGRGRSARVRDVCIGHGGSGAHVRSQE